jgi:hypothetical protein
LSADGEEAEGKSVNKLAVGDAAPYFRRAWVGQLSEKFEVGKVTVKSLKFEKYQVRNDCPVDDGLREGKAVRPKTLCSRFGLVAFWLAHIQAVFGAVCFHATNYRTR